MKAYEIIGCQTYLPSKDLMFITRLYLLISKGHSHQTQNCKSSSPDYIRCCKQERREERAVMFNPHYLFGKRRYIRKKVLVIK
jgi:hypothetical protein